MMKIPKEIFYGWSGGAATVFTGLKVAGMEFNGSGFVLAVIVAMLCITFLITFLVSLHWLTSRTDLTAILTSWATGEQAPPTENIKPDRTQAKPTSKDSRPSKNDKDTG